MHTEEALNKTDGATLLAVEQTDHAENLDVVESVEPVEYVDAADAAEDPAEAEEASPELTEPIVETESPVARLRSRARGGDLHRRPARRRRTGAGRRPGRRRAGRGRRPAAASREDADRAAGELSRLRDEQTAHLDRERAAALTGLAEQKATLEAQVEALREQENDYRSQLRHQLTEHLALLGDSGSGTPAPWPADLARRAFLSACHVGTGSQVRAYRDVVADPQPDVPVTDVTEARHLFPATADRCYFNTAAVGLASHALARTYHDAVDEWVTDGLDFVRGEQAANDARAQAARLMGADPADVALIPSMSSAAGLVASQFGTAASGDNVVIGEREYSSNHFPWRQLERKGYDVRQVPFRHGGLEPEDVEQRVDAGTRLVAFSGVQSATGHRSDIASISTLARRGRGDRVRGRLADGGRGTGVRGPASRGRAGDGGPQVPAQRRPGDGLLLPVQGRAGAVHPHQRRLARGRRPVHQLLRPDHGAVADGIPVRQLHQLAGGLRQQDVRSASSTSSDPTPSSAGTATSRSCCGAPSPVRAGSRSPCPRRTGAPSSGCRSATSNRPGSSTPCPSSGSSPRHATAPFASRSTSTTTRTTSTSSSRSSGHWGGHPHSAERRHGPPEMPPDPGSVRHWRAMIGQSTMKPLGPHGPPGNPMTAPDSARSST